MVLAFYFGEVRFVADFVNRPWLSWHHSQLFLAAQELHDLGETGRSINRQPIHYRRFRSILMRHNEAFPAPFACLQRNRQRSSHWTQFTGKRQLSTDIAVIQFRDPILLVQLQHRQRDRQIKTWSLLPYRSRSQVDGDPSPRPPQRTVAERAQDPISALLDRGIRQTDYRDPSLRSPPGVYFDLNFEGIHSDDRCRIDLRWHNSTRKCSFISTFARNVLLLAAQPPPP